MSFRVIEKGEVEPVSFYAVDALNQPLTGKADLFIRVRRGSDNFYLDWDDLLFKSSGWTTLDKPLTEVDATNSPGLYEITGGFDSSVITNLNIEENLTFTSLQNPGTDVAIPPPVELQVRVDHTKKLDSAQTLLPGNAVSGSVLDRLCNKDGTKSYSQATDSLEASRDNQG